MGALLRVMIALVLLALMAPPVGAAQGESGATAPPAAEQPQDALPIELRRVKADLDDARSRLSELEEQIRLSSGGDPGAATGGLEALRSEASKLEEEITDLGEAFQIALVDLINADPPIEGQPAPPLVQEALRMKADEDRILAQEYIDPAGDYPRAIQMFESILEYAPDDPGVLAALQRAREGRYMTEERFRRVEIGMTQPEVREILGPAHILNRRSYEEQAVQAWFYPKESDDHHAAIYFWQVAGQWQVYRLEYEINDIGELN
jgi:hypothetical protein